VTLEHVPTSVVAITGGNAIVGRALELLLRSIDFRAKYLFDPSLDDPELFSGAKLLLLAPGLDSERREALLRLINSKPSVARIPVLELINHARAAQVGDGHFVPWPCRAEELKRQVTDTLFDRSEASKDGHEAGQVGQECQALQKEKGEVTNDQGVDRSK
jgi:hypothetical protein